MENKRIKKKKRKMEDETGKIMRENQKPKTNIKMNE